MAQAILAYLDAGKSDRFIGAIASHWKDTPLRDITGVAVRQSGPKLYPEASRGTWNRQVITPTKAIINYAAEFGWCSPIKVKRYDHVAETKTPASLEWVNAFSTQATEDGLSHLAALCLFMFGTAARVGEATQMTWNEINLSTGKATLYGDKPKPWERTAHLQSRVVAAIGNIPSNRNPDGQVFKYAETGSVEKVWRNVCVRAGIEPLTPHCCRHGFATHMLRKGVDVVTIAKRGGWKDPAIVLRTYAHALDDVTITDALFDTPATQSDNLADLSIGKERKKTT
ncbi:tyrosine-type recombinase/integrase [Salipiger aestuarii]|uniref:tyrosine-type recombinase/integrase n=1 Tax=Salipiger aestuarii TaxID=568098 RepID=UPI001CC2FED9|nr:site-specific integrase [Salipiger aestuarii]